MNATKKKIAIVGFSALLLASAGATLAGHRGHGGCDRGMGMGGSMSSMQGPGMRGPMQALRKLDNLTDKQRQSIKDIHKSTRQSMFELMGAMQDNRMELREASRKNADMETIRDLAKKQGEQVERMIVLRAETRAKVDAVLTEEQRQQLRSKRRPGRGKGAN
jgi:Spy/CpxP family protein refolding chaperone